MTDITLLNDQAQDVENMERIFFEKQTPFCLSLAPLGSGKTFTSSYIGKKHFKHIIVIAPKSTLPKWDTMKNMYKIPIIGAVTYASLRGQKGKQPNFKYLVREDYSSLQSKRDGTVEQVWSFRYDTTEEYKKFVEEGLLVIIDEFQNIKNATAQQAACDSLLAPIFSQHKLDPTLLKSRALLLSGSPIDKEHQVVTLFKTLKVMTKTHLAHYNPRAQLLTWSNAGFGEILDYAITVDKTGTIRLVETMMRERYINATLLRTLRAVYSCIFDESASRSTRVYNGSSMQTDRDIVPFIYKLFQEVIKPHISSFCSYSETENLGPAESLSPNVKPILHRENGFYKLESETLQAELANAVADLKNVLNFNSVSETISYNANNTAAALGAMTTALMKIETCKIPLFIRVGLETLQANANAKLVICVNYKKSLAQLVEAFSENYKVLCMDGSTSVQERKKILESFASADINSERVLIGNLAVLSTGIDLDDKMGTRPRVCLVSPNYSCINLYQLSFRFLRLDTKSDSLVRIVYVDERGCLEIKILDALSRKGNVMKDTTKQQQNENIIYPCNYKAWYEQRSLNL